MSNVQIKNIEKSYGDVKIMHGVSLDIEDGEFVILVGPSGCGKSTLLRMIAGLEQISEGTIRIGGQVVNDVRPKDRNIAMVFQSYALYPHKTVRQNMAFALLLAKRPKSEIDAKVKAAADILDLTHLLDRYPKQLSGGQRQRVAMGRAIVRNPEVFLFDEPLSNLDAKLRVQMRAEIKALHKRLNTTIIYVTHDQVEAMTMADRIVVMNGGRIEQAGRPLDLYDRPNNLFVATFLGSPSMNLLKGRLDGSTFVSAGGAKFPVDPKLAKVAVNRPLVAGIRPEHIVLAQSNDKGAIASTVKIDEPTGAETHLVVTVGKDELQMTHRDRISVETGQTLNLVFPVDRVQLFDAESTTRIVSLG